MPTEADDEERLSSSLRSVLADLPLGAAIPDSEPFREALSALEYFIPHVLAEIHDEWISESLDGVYPVLSRKTGEREAEIFGLGCLISDQTLAALHLRLQVAPEKDEVSWLECRLDEKTDRGFKRIMQEKLGRELAHLRGLQDPVQGIDWAYKVTFGTRIV